MTPASNSLTFVAHLASPIVGRLLAIKCYIGSLLISVRKISQKQKNYLVRKSREGNRQRTRSHHRQIRYHEARERFNSIRKFLPETTWTKNARPGYISFDPPKHFSLFENYEETLAFLLDLRILTTEVGQLSGPRRPSIFANFPIIENIDAASGLVLAAEVDRWTRLADRRRMRSFDDEWHPQIREFFHSAGLFELLKVEPKTTSHYTDDGPLKALKYQTGIVAEGETADAMRNELERLCGESIGSRTHVYDAISEAMTNVVHHAYPVDFKFWPNVPIKRWWLGGSWQVDKGTVTVQMYDQGVGIPKTLPKSRHWAEVLPILWRLDSESTDAGMIEAAMDYGRTSTGESGRGKGLAQMVDWIVDSGSGSLKILSGKGKVTMLPAKKPIKETLSAEFPGTLVEWEVCLNG